MPDSLAVPQAGEAIQNCLSKECCFPGVDSTILGSYSTLCRSQSFPHLSLMGVLAPKHPYGCLSLAKKPSSPTYLRLLQQAEAGLITENAGHRGVSGGGQRANNIGDVDIGDQPGGFVDDAENLTRAP
jgi:hypothetical protein